jgi:hypothetical protein
MNAMASVPQLGEHAAETIRELNHRTRHHGALADPVELSWLLSDLAAMASRLPQLLDQLDRWLRHEHHAGRVRADDNTDPGQLVCLTTAQLHQAEHCANSLADALDTAHQHVAHLAIA